VAVRINSTSQGLCLCIQRLRSRSRFAQALAFLFLRAFHFAGLRDRCRARRQHQADDPQTLQVHADSRVARCDCNRQLHQLHKNIDRAYHSHAAVFPKKKILGSTDKNFVQKRKEKLQRWLNVVSRLPGIFDFKFMSEFISTDCQQRGTSKKKQQTLGTQARMHCAVR
jgi:hypothetical protein